MKQDLVPVVGVDKDNCVNCHACITACPVKYCNDGSQDHIEINENMCIGCGCCIAACTHEARTYLDDWDQFLADVKSGVPMVAIVAPAVASNFPNQYLEVNGWLKSLGVKATFDVSFGAELTVKSYLEHVKNNAPKTVIAQPCPAIVSYVEIYKPELLPYLAPADSPMLHTIKMVQEFYPEYKNHKAVVISPCLAKKREFVETGLGDYNVSYKSIHNYLTQNRVDLSQFPKVDYDNDPAERAVLFSTPGGLMRTAEREFPGISSVTRKIEGPHTIYEYLDKLPEMIQEGKNPVLIDCLNCEMGCNGGTGTLNQEKSPDEVEYEVEKRNGEMQEKYKSKSILPKFMQKSKLTKTINRFWKPGLYDRTYVNLQENNGITKPTERELSGIYEKMSKFEEGDIYNCSSCGYGSCEDMAVAVFNGLNTPENCHFYKHGLVDEQLEQIKLNEDALKEESETLKEIISEVMEIMSEINGVSASTEEYLKLLNDISSDINQNDGNIQTIVREAQYGVQEAQKSTSIMSEMDKAIAHVTKDVMSISANSMNTFEIATNGFNVVEKTVQGMEEIKESVLSASSQINELGNRSSKIGEIIKVIDGISRQTNMLALNAAVEAARAGEHGRGFAVVADEVKKLAEKSSLATQEIALIIEAIQTETQEVVQAMKAGTVQVQKGSELAASANGSLQNIIDSVGAMVEQIQNVTAATEEITAASSEVVDTVGNISRLSETNVMGLNEVNAASSDAVELIYDIQGLSEKNKKAILSIEGRYETIKGLIQHK